MQSYALAAAAHSTFQPPAHLHGPMAPSDDSFGHSSCLSGCAGVDCLKLCLRHSSTPCRVPEAQQLSDEDAQVRTAFATALAGLARPLAAHAEQQGWALPGGEAASAGALPEDLQLQGLLPLEAAHSRLNMQEPAGPTGAPAV